MKIIGQSTVADGNPYVHLGYTSAFSFEKGEPHLLISGITMLIAGVIVGFSFIFGKNKSGSTTIRIVRKKNVALARVGTILVIAGGVGTVLSWIFYVKPEFPALRTCAAAGRILDQIEMCRHDGKPVPEDMAQLGMSFNVRVVDGWSREMRLTKEVKTDDKTVYSVVSAGPDGKFGTSDDISQSTELTRPYAASRVSASRPAQAGD